MTARSKKHRTGRGRPSRELIPSKVVPHPGSPAAIGQGCTCPILDNHYGAGMMLPGRAEPAFWITGGCPLHTRKEQDHGSTDDKGTEGASK